jgi:hypothetical protein
MTTDLTTFPTAPPTAVESTSSLSCFDHVQTLRQDSYVLRVFNFDLSILFQ